MKRREQSAFVLEVYIVSYFCYFSPPFTLESSTKGYTFFRFVDIFLLKRSFRFCPERNAVPAYMTNATLLVCCNLNPLLSFLARTGHKKSNRTVCHKTRKSIAVSQNRSTTIFYANKLQNLFHGYTCRV
jgi:hypothetical protein